MLPVWRRSLAASLQGVVRRASEWKNQARAWKYTFACKLNAEFGNFSHLTFGDMCSIRRSACCLPSAPRLLRFQFEG